MKNPSILPSSLTALRTERSFAGASTSPLVKQTVLVCAVVLLAVAMVIHPLAGNAAARENGPLEMLQFLLLASGFVILGWQTIRQSEARPGLLLFSLLYLTLALRELDLRPFSAPDWLIQATLHQRHLWLTPLWILAIGFAILRRADIKSWIDMLDLPSLKALGITAIAIYLGSFAFEKHLIMPKGAIATFGEETLELLLAVSLLAFARGLSLRTRFRGAFDYSVVRSFN